MPIPPEVSALLTDVGKAAVLGLASYVAHGVRQIKLTLGALDTRMTRVEHTVFGVNNDNGMRQASKDADAALDDHEHRITRLEARAS